MIEALCASFLALVGWLIAIERRLSRIEGKLTYIEKLIINGFDGKAKTSYLH